MQSTIHTSTDADSTDIEVKNAEESISSKDAIMEPNILAVIDTLIHNCKWSPETIVEKLAYGYAGYAQMSQLLAQWLLLCNEIKVDTDIGLKASSASNEKIESESRESRADQILTEQISLLIKQKFNKEAVDSLLDMDSDVPRWLLDMINHKTWRRLLIELFDNNRGSALLGYCLKKISAMGFHRLL